MKALPLTDGHTLVFVQKKRTAAKVAKDLT